jgi:hypothetical protein
VERRRLAGWPGAVSAPREARTRGATEAFTARARDASPSTCNPTHLISRIEIAADLGVQSQTIAHCDRRVRLRDRRTAAAEILLVLTVCARVTCDKGGNYAGKYQLYSRG